MTPLRATPAAGAALGFGASWRARLGAGASAGAACAVTPRIAPRLAVFGAAGVRYAVRLEARPAASSGMREGVCLLDGSNLLRLTLLDGRAPAMGAAVTLLILDARGAEALPPTAVPPDPALPGVYPYAGAPGLFPAAGDYVAHWTAAVGGHARPATLAFRVV